MAPRDPTKRYVRQLTPALRHSYLSIFILLAVSACTTPVQQPSASSDDAISDCESLFAALNAIVKAAGVQDGGAVQVKGFPYLRVDRFLASSAAKISDAMLELIPIARKLVGSVCTNEF